MARRTARTFTTPHVMINGRVYFVDHLTDFTKTARNKYTVKRNTTVYTIEGGRHAGGTSREWFVECAEWKKPIVCTSVADAIKMLDGM